MKHLASESVDLVLCDLPYGATANGWDTPIDMDELWEQYRRIISRAAPSCFSDPEPSLQS